MYIKKLISNNNTLGIHMLFWNMLLNISSVHVNLYFEI